MGRRLDAVKDWPERQLLRAALDPELPEPDLSTAPSALLADLTKALALRGPSSSRGVPLQGRAEESGRNTK